MTEEAAYVYVLRSVKDGRHYIGCSKDPQRRLIEHNQGETPSTKGRGPWQVIYLRPFGTLTDARRHEEQIKRKKSRRYIEWLIQRG